MQVGWGRHKLRLSTNSRLSIHDCCSANNNCDRPPCSLPHTPPRISQCMFITTNMDDHDEEKRTEHNLFVRSGKSKAEVTNNRRLRLTYCILLKQTNDRHKTSRGLSATAGLLVLLNRDNFNLSKRFNMSQFIYFNILLRNFYDYT